MLPSDLCEQLRYFALASVFKIAWTINDAYRLFYTLPNYDVGCQQSRIGYLWLQIGYN